MPALPAWLASIEALLNRGIDGSMRASAAARRLHDRSFELDVAGVLRVRIAATAGRLALLPGGVAAADASVQGSPIALFQLLSGQPSRAEIRGDAEIASQFRELLRLARPDLEEELARVLGDLPARRLSELARGGLSFARRARRTVRENVREYLEEESRDLVSRPELDQFLSEVDRLRETADRVDARLARLERLRKDEDAV